MVILLFFNSSYIFLLSKHFFEKDRMYKLGYSPLVRPCFFSFPLFLSLCNDGWKLRWQSDCPDSLDGHLMIRDSSWNETDWLVLSTKTITLTMLHLKQEFCCGFTHSCLSAARRAHVWYKTNLSHWEYICSESRDRGEWSCLMGWSF